MSHEAYGPSGEPDRHSPLGELEAGLRALPAAPRDAGRIALIVRRHADGVRETLERTLLTPESGIPGDGWSRRPPRDPAAQLAVMRRDVAELIAGGQPLTVFGDNLFVDLDLSTANLPTGTRLAAGDALAEVTPKPHDGCRKFMARVGEGGLHLVQAPGTRHLNLRGVFWKVLHAGDVYVGAPIAVLSRGAAS
jgi:MOSC domain-containing protein YiiM